jgi:hypothetical protein
VFWGCVGEDTLNDNNEQSFRALKHVSRWCSYQTIERWLKSHESYASYSKNIKPGLTEGNRQKQVNFSKRVHARWDLPPHTKILWCMSDEKWWFGLIARTFAKMCPELGVEKKSFSAHHKSHINKVQPIPYHLYLNCTTTYMNALNRIGHGPRNGRIPFSRLA